jgi:hypothetical protein
MNMKVGDDEEMDEMSVHTYACMALTAIGLSRRGNVSHGRPVDHCHVDDTFVGIGTPSIRPATCITNIPLLVTALNGHLYSTGRRDCQI